MLSKRSFTSTASFSSRQIIKQVSSPQIVPIISSHVKLSIKTPTAWALPGNVFKTIKWLVWSILTNASIINRLNFRSEERRVGKECRYHCCEWFWLKKVDVG